MFSYLNQPIDPEAFMCDAINNYQVTGDKKGFARMIDEEVNRKLYYCAMLDRLIYPLFDINYSRTHPMFARIFEVYDLLINHESS